LPSLVLTVLILFALFQIKHMFADYFLQTPKMLSGRGEYWHMGRAQHALVHSAGSVICFLLVGSTWLFVVLIVLFEIVVHFNIDWCKASWCEARNLDPTKAAFWRAAGFDQAMHQLTYVIMVAAWVMWGQG